METRTRQDTTEYQNKMPHASTTTFGAVTTSEDAIVKLRSARFCNHTYLVQVEKGLIRTLLLPSLPPPVTFTLLVQLPSCHCGSLQQGVLIISGCRLLEFSIILLNQCGEQTFGHGTGITGSSIHNEGRKFESDWKCLAGTNNFGQLVLHFGSFSDSCGETAGATFVYDFPQATDRLRNTAHRVEAASFSGECVNLQIQSRSHDALAHRAISRVRWSPVDDDPFLALVAWVRVSADLAQNPTQNQSSFSPGAPVNLKILTGSKCVVLHGESVCENVHRTEEPSLDGWERARPICNDMSSQKARDNRTHKIVRQLIHAVSP